MAKVKVTNTVNHRVIVDVPTLAFRREFAPGASFDIEDTMLEQLMFDNGVRYMLETGMLYIDDMAEKKALGLEPEDANEPEKVIVLSDKERRQYMVSLPQKDFEAKVRKLSFEQVKELADYAVKNRLIDFDKCEFLKAMCGRDIITAVRLSKQNKED